jgi:hypothetical protein
MDSGFHPPKNGGFAGMTMPVVPEYARDVSSQRKLGSKIEEKPTAGFRLSPAKERRVRRNDKIKDFAVHKRHVIPAQAGIQNRGETNGWVPAFTRQKTAGSPE